MKSSTRLDSALFQLTPTRTRCDLVISANGKTEKIASGLLNPFLAHLKTAQEQMAKGGYSIILEPEPGTDVSWFTKGTVERFVRFVSTPEVLERVYTLESEILQIEEAIAIQGNNEMAASAVEESPSKPTESVEGNRTLPDTGDEKAIVLYKPGVHPPESNGSTAQEGNSKVQLLKVLETRKTVLQKEQGMAFARAVAAGFDIDNIAPLMSFSECFGASRLMDACKRFKELWKKKHETGQWVEIEAAEAISSRSDFSAMNASGIMLSSVAKSWPESHAEFGSESNGKSSSLASTDEKTASEHQPPPGPQEYFQGQFPHQMFPPWPIHSPPGTVPVFQAYPMQGMPYYQNYPGAGPFYQPPYPAVEDPRLNSGQRMVVKRHSMDSSNGNVESEMWESDAHRAKSSDDAELEKEPRKRSGRSGKKQSGVVVIRNLNYIASKGQNNSDDESQSASDSESGGEDEMGGSEMKHKNSTRSSKKENNVRNSTNEEEIAFGKDADGGHWQAFQSFLLRDADEDKHAGDQSMFSMENKVHSKRRQNKAGEDAVLFSGQDIGESQNGGVMDMQKMSGNMAHMRRSSTDEPLISKRDGSMGADGHGDIFSSEINGRRLGYSRSTNDDFMIDRQSGFTGSSDPLAVNGFDRVTNTDRRSSQNMDDASYIVPLRSTSGQVGNRNAIDMDSELPSASQKADRAGNRVNYEPEGLSMMPQRGAENGGIGYDPALDYEMQAHTADGASLKKKNKEAVTHVKQGSKKPDKGPKLKLLADDKKKNVGPIRRSKPSKLSPLDEARARAEKLRTYKADLLKMKKEKEEAEMKRLEALKIERQKRIAARGATNPAQPTRTLVPTKTSPSSLKGTKFSDSAPGPSSPLQRYHVRTSSMGSSDSQKISKTSSRLNAGSQSAGNKLTQSATSLHAPKKDGNGVASETKVSMARIRRLSEPKMSTSHPISSLRAQSAESSSKSKVSDGSERKKISASKSKVSDGSEIKKISAIVNYDKSKAATLPELKIKMSKGPDIVQSKSTTKEVTQKGTSIKSSTTSEGSEAKRRNEKISDHSEADENPIIEKTVVMLECGKPSAPAAQASDENLKVVSKPTEDLKIRETMMGVSEYTAIRAPVSNIMRDAADGESTERRIKEQTTTYEAAMDDAKKELPKVSSIDIAEEPYRPPYARVSSLEDPCTKNSEYGKAAPTNLESSVNVQAHVFDSRSLKLEKIPETVDKPKESSKGFRRLLKFGRKSHSSGAGEHNSETDNVSVNGSEADDNGTSTAASSEVHTLKNLISQDETPAAGATPQKSSRHFSLLSPFRGKTSDKKQTT